MNFVMVWVSHHLGTPTALAWREVSVITPLDAKPIVSQHRRPGTRTSKPHLRMKTQNPTGTKAEQDRAGPGGAGSACAGILWRQAGKSYSPAGSGGLFLLPVSSTSPEESVELPRTERQEKSPQGVPRSPLPRT